MALSAKVVVGQLTGKLSRTGLNNLFKSIVVTIQGAVDVITSIEDRSLPGTKLELQAVDTDELAASAVTTAKLENASVTAAKLSGNAAYFFATAASNGGATSITSASSGGFDVFAFDSDPNPSAYTRGQIFRFIAANANTQPVKINVNSIGDVHLYKRNSLRLNTGDIKAGMVITCEYDGTNMRMLNAPAGEPNNVAVATFSTDGVRDLYTFTPGQNGLSYVTNGIYYFQIPNGGTNTLDTVKIQFTDEASEKTLLKANAVNIQPGELRAGDIVAVVYGGANFKMLSPTYSPPVAVIGAARGLKISTNGADTVTITADEVVLKEASGTTLHPHLAQNVSATVNMDDMGLNARDNTSRDAGWYVIWLLYSIADNAVAAVASKLTNTNGTINAPDLSDSSFDGYQFRAAIGVVYDSGSALRRSFQVERKVGFMASPQDNSQALTGYTNNTFTSATVLASLLPPIAKTWSGMLGSSATIAAPIGVGLVGDGSGTEAYTREHLHLFVSEAGAATMGMYEAFSFMDVPVVNLSSGQVTFKYRASPAGGTFAYRVTDFTF